MKVSPSILSADFSHLLNDVQKIEKGDADFIHVDVMDGHFVPNISFGSVVMKSLCGKTSIPFDVHLMIENPEKYIKDFVTDQTEYVTVHSEVLQGSVETIDLIHSFGIKAGISINPETNYEKLIPYLDKCDLFLIMSVHPGFGGQKFIPEVLDKVEKLTKYKKENDANFLIEIDGGINLENAPLVKEKGCDIVVAGSSIFNSNNPTEVTKQFKIL